MTFGCGHRWGTRSRSRAVPAGVAQICNLLYRRLVVGRALGSTEGSERFPTQQITNLRYAFGRARALCLAQAHLPAVLLACRIINSSFLRRASAPGCRCPWAEAARLPLFHRYAMIIRNLRAAFGPGPFRISGFGLPSAFGFRASDFLPAPGASPGGHPYAEGRGHP